MTLADFSAALAVGLLAVGAAGCHGQGTRDASTLHAAGTSLQHLEGSRWLWVESDCSDGSLDLAKLGFDRELTLSVDKGTLTMTFDTELATEGCSSTAVWVAAPATGAELWRFEPQAVVTLPAEAACGASERAATDGTLRLTGDLLELVTHRSAWCRGFDARFVYRRADPKRLEPRQVVMRYVAAFDRANAAAIAGLFDDNGSLVEPFTKTEDGNYKRHEGRAAVRAWYTSAFASTPWLAMRLTSIEPSGAEGQLIARWEYMDAQLAEPLRGRNLFVIAGGEIYETEVQLFDDPKPAARKPDAASAAPASSAKEATGSKPNP